MIRALTISGVFFALAPIQIHADYAVEERGSWPEQLEPLRKDSLTYEGPKQPALHYAIRFSTREQFEAAWPLILKVKSRGAPIFLKRGPNFWLNGAKRGVCIHTPPAGTEPQEGSKVGETNWEKTNYIELIVDGDIVNLNRIQLPQDTPIIDERFKKTTK